jgi:hypothetical protein
MRVSPARQRGLRPCVRSSSLSERRSGAGVLGAVGPWRQTGCAIPLLADCGGGTRVVGAPVPFGSPGAVERCGPPVQYGLACLDGCRHASRRLAGLAVWRRRRGSASNVGARLTERAQCPTHNAPRSRRSERRRKASQHSDQPLWRHSDRPLWRPGPTTHVSAPRVSRTITNPHTGEALFGGNDLQRQDSQPMHRLFPFRNDPERTHGRSPVWRADPRCSYERSVASRTLRVAARLGWSFLITP